MSSAKSLQFNDKPSGKSLIQIKNKRGPKINPCGTPEGIPFQKEFCTFNTTFCFWYFKKSFKRYKSFPDIPLRFNFRIPPFVFGILKNLLKNTTGFQICNYGLILELALHAKLYQRLLICLETLLLPRDHYQMTDIFLG